MFGVVLKEIGQPFSCMQAHSGRAAKFEIDCVISRY